jgi:O-acetylhomoserine (thiol)-lyase
MSEDRVPAFATLAVHAGADPLAGAPPADAGPSRVVDDPDRSAALSGLVGGGATDVLEQRIAALEGGTAAVAVASGSAARLVVLHALMQPGDEFIAARQLDGGSINQFTNAFPGFGWSVKWADIDDIGSFEAAVTPRTKAIFIESLANPGGVADTEAMAAVAKRAGVPLIVDNTLATPCLCRPLAVGADVVVHAHAGFIGGHGNARGGVIVDGGAFNWTASDRYPMLSAPRPDHDGVVLGEAFGNFAFATACRMPGSGDLGLAMPPFDALLVLAGMETLPLRMRKHSENARAVAGYLAGHDGVTWVRYAGLSGDRHHQLALKYCPPGAGAVLTFGTAGGAEAAAGLVDRVELFARAAAIGGTHSLIDRPWSTTHRQLSAEARRAAGIGPDAVRLSVGIEDIADILADLDRALAAA